MEALLSARDARLAGRKKESNPEDWRVVGVNQADMTVATREITGVELESTVKNEGFAKEGVSTVSKQESSSRRSVGRPKRKAVVQSGMFNVIAPWF